MASKNDNELAKLIEARLKTAQEEGENITPEDILAEIGMSDDEKNQLSAGVNGFDPTSDLCKWACFNALGWCMCL